MRHYIHIAALRQMEEGLTLQALAAEEEKSRRLQEEAELAMQLLQQQEQERKEQVLPYPFYFTSLARCE
jgi:hypothetical protein